jgi:hypothetical protein
MHLTHKFATRKDAAMALALPYLTLQGGSSSAPCRGGGIEIEPCRGGEWRLDMVDLATRLE